MWAALMGLAILADDLTGACDTGSLFAGVGAVPVTLWPAIEAIGDATAETGVRVVDTESRRLPAPAAAARVSRAARARPASRYFKKIDSTMRGPIGAEVESLMTTVGAGCTLLCPAFPAQGRTVVDRQLAIGGVPIGETAFARAGATRTTASTSSVIDILRPQLTRPVAWLPLAEVRAGVDALRARLARLDGMIIVADAETDADLAALVDAALALDSPPLLAGSAGLARALAARLGVLVERVALPAARRWLVIAGSLHPATRRQAETAHGAGLTVLASPDGHDDDAGDAARRLAAQAALRLAEDPFDIVLATGGDTALALYEALGAERLELVGPPAPGLALGRLGLPGGRELWLVTKAGGFGDPDLFVSLAKAAA